MSIARDTIVEALNRECDCASTDLGALHDSLDARLGPSASSLADTHPHLFSAAPFFVSGADLAAMQDIVAALETVIQLPAYQHAVLAGSPPVAQLASKTSGVFMGFDFHLAPGGPQLIEINTNAGGAFLNVAARAAEHACCEAFDAQFAARPQVDAVEGAIHAMFLDEWRQARGAAPLRSVVIVDERPEQQFLYPEFQLARQFFEQRGIRARIADPTELEIAGKQLLLRGEAIDLVYNRLTDFYLEEPRNAVLRAACEGDLAVLTPHPRAHALFANKRNLGLLSDTHTLRSLGATEQAIGVLTAGIPLTRSVDGAAERWWAERKQWFFKPAGGYGSRGAYRGDKLTRRVFDEIMKGGYVAQQLVPPSQRLRMQGRSAFKADLRCYAYRGVIQLVAARLYQGQTTNFRTAGGGFASVYPIRR